jgi:hypothetical protein
MEAAERRGNARNHGNPIEEPNVNGRQISLDLSKYGFIPTIRRRY